MEAMTRCTHCWSHCWSLFIASLFHRYLVRLACILFYALYTFCKNICFVYYNTLCVFFFLPSDIFLLVSDKNTRTYFFSWLKTAKYTDKPHVSSSSLYCMFFKGWLVTAPGFLHFLNSPTFNKKKMTEKLYRNFTGKLHALQTLSVTLGFAISIFQHFRRPLSFSPSRAKGNSC